MSAQYVVPEEWVEAGAVALCWVGFHQPLPGKTAKSYWRKVSPAAKEQYRKEVRAALAAVLPLAVAQERERCANVVRAKAEELRCQDNEWGGPPTANSAVISPVLDDLAAAIHQEPAMSDRCEPPKPTPETWLGEFAVAAHNAGWDVKIDLVPVEATPAEVVTLRSRVERLEAALRGWADAIDAWRTFECENPNDSTKAWDDLYYAVELAENAARAALKDRP